MVMAVTSSRMRCTRHVACKDNKKCIQKCDRKGPLDRLRRRRRIIFKCVKGNCVRRLEMESKNPK